MLFQWLARRQGVAFFSDPASDHLADIAAVQRVHTTFFLQLEIKVDRLLEKVESLKTQIADSITERGGPMPSAPAAGPIMSKLGFRQIYLAYLDYF